MSAIAELFKSHGRLIKVAWPVILEAAVLAAGGAWWLSSTIYSREISTLKTTLETKEFPKPVEVVKQVPVPDPTQAETIVRLQSRVKELESERRPAKSGAPSQAPRIGSISGGAVSIGQTGGFTGQIYGAPLPDRHVTPIVGQRILALLQPPSKVELVQLQIMAGEHADERARYAGEIKQFLKGKGYKVKDEVASFISSDPAGPSVGIDNETTPGQAIISINENR